MLPAYNEERVATFELFAAEYQRPRTEDLGDLAADPTSRRKNFVG